MPRCYEEAIVVVREFDCVCLHNSVRHHSRDNVAEKTSSANSLRGQPQMNPAAHFVLCRTGADLFGCKKAHKAQTQLPLCLDRGDFPSPAGLSGRNFGAKAEAGEGGRRPVEGRRDKSRSCGQGEVSNAFLTAGFADEHRFLVGTGRRAVCTQTPNPRYRTRFNFSCQRPGTAYQSPSSGRLYENFGNHQGSSRQRLLRIGWGEGGQRPDED